MIHKITPSLGSNYWLERLDTKLKEPTNQYSKKVPEVIKLTFEKYYYKTLGTSVINNPMYLIIL